jgi:hypothetical protein
MAKKLSFLKKGRVTKVMAGMETAGLTALAGDSWHAAKVRGPPTGESLNAIKLR